MSRRRPTLGPMPIQYRREWQRLAILNVGVAALLVGVLLILGIEVTSS